jgi:hypothetical protein
MLSSKSSLGADDRNPAPVTVRLRRGRPTVNVRGLGRLGMLAVGLGIGAAVVHSPVAWADSSTDWLASIDNVASGAALPAADPSTLNLDISFDGYTLYQSGSAEAVTQSGEYGLAIASGADSEAFADGGTGDYALADGSGAYAEAGATGGSGDNFDSAIDIGNNTGKGDGAEAFDGSNDRAIDIGNNSGSHDLAFAGEGNNDSAADVGNNSGSEDGPYAYVGNYDSATQFGNNTGYADGPEGAYGNYNSATQIGNNSGLDDHPSGYEGNYDSATQFGNNSGDESGPLAGYGNYDSAADYASNTGEGDGPFAGDGNSNFAEVSGTNSSADAGGFNESLTSNDNIAYVLDPFGADGSYADAGANSTAAGGYDLAAVLGVDNTTATATGAEFLYDIVTALGNQAGSF